MNKWYVPEVEGGGGGGTNKRRYRKGSDARGNVTVLATLLIVKETEYLQY